MFSKIITVLFAVYVIPAVNGFIIDSKLRVLEPILKCFKEDAPEFAGEKAMAAKLDLDLDADFRKWSCLLVGEAYTCVTDVLKNTPSPVPKIFLFYGAYSYQTAYLLKKANVCPDIKYDDVKKIVVDSGILKDKGLSNIENDDYYKCAGDAMEKCFIGGTNVLEHKQGDSDASDNASDAYIKCIENQAKTCKHPIMHHFFELIEAYKKRVKQLERLESKERQG